MKNKWKKGIAAFMAVAMLGCAVDMFAGTRETVVYGAEEAYGNTVEVRNTNLQPELSYNLDKQDYDTYGGPVYSYLVAEENGYMRVEYIRRTTYTIVEGETVEQVADTTTKLVVEHYDDMFGLVSRR